MNHSHLQNQSIEPIRWPAPVIRLSLRWDGERWLIASEHRVKSMTLPAPASLPDGDKSRGFWIETIDREGRVRHRDVMADPLLGMEQFSPDGAIKRLDHPAHNVEIEVLIPDLPELAEVHVVSNSVARRGDREHGPSRTQLSIRGRTPNDGRDGPDGSDLNDRDHGNPDHPDDADRHGHGTSDEGEPRRPA